MNPLALAVCITLLPGDDTDPNRLPLKEAQRYAQACIDQALPFGDAQIEMAVTAERPSATYGEGGGGMALADNDLTAKKLTKLAKDIVPVGQLWLRKWTLAEKGKGVPAGRLRMVSINVDDKDRPMAVFLLGVRKGAKGPELVVYARENEPLAVYPLMEIKRDLDVPLHLAWQRGEKDVDGLALNVLGEYEVVVPITRAGK